MTKEICLQHNVIFNTVCLTVKEGADFENAYQELVDITKLARKEPGCIAFTPAPGNFEKKDIFLWEIWADKASLEAHDAQEYVIKHQQQGSLDFNWISSYSKK